MMQNQLFRDLCNVCLYIHSLSLRRLVANESVAFSRAEYKQGMETPTWLFTVEIVYSVVAVMGFVQLAVCYLVALGVPGLVGASPNR